MKWYRLLCRLLGDYTSFLLNNYGEVPIIGPPMVLVEGGLNSEQVSLMRPIYTEKCILVLKQVILIARVILIIAELYSITNLF